MADILSLSKIRKAKARAEKVSTAEANRAKFGRTKAEKSESAAKTALRTRQLDVHKRDKS